MLLISSIFQAWQNPFLVSNLHCDRGEAFLKKLGLKLIFLKKLDMSLISLWFTKGKKLKIQYPLKWSDYKYFGYTLYNML